MTREEVVKGLEAMIRMSYVTCAEENVILAALVLLSVPEDQRVGRLDALCKSLENSLASAVHRIIAAEKKLTRVRELCGEWVDVFGIEETVPNANIGRVVKLIDAALADETTMKAAAVKPLGRDL